MPEVYPVIEGDEKDLLTRNFIGASISQHYEKLNSLAEAGGYKALNDFEFCDPSLLEDLGIELDEEQTEWHDRDQGIEAFKRLSEDSGLPDDAELKTEVADLLEVLKNIPDGSKGWNLQHDI